MSIAEVKVENYLVDQVHAEKGMALKMVPFHLRGVPDRLILLPGAFVCFVEVKRPKGGRIARLQYWWRDRLTALGIEHRFISTFEEVDTLMTDWRRKCSKT